MLFVAMWRFFCLVFLVAPTASAFVCDNFADCRALVKFKEGIRSDPNGHLQDWNEANSFCNWTGITCHPQLENRVIAIKLINMDLRGSISPFLSNLSLLTNLSLQQNSFHGEIPTALGGLSRLACLNMSENKLEGGIPASIHGCQSLKFMDLTINNLSGIIPDELGWMKNLTRLSLSVNSLHGVIPSFLSNLTELTRLDLAVNYFTGRIPPELGALTKLEIMYFHTNYLEGPIPASLANCSALREISLEENQLTGEIPLELGNKLQNLQKLWVLDNKISGRIPVTLSNLSQLTLLDLTMNQLEGEVPAELGKLMKLEILYLHHNNLVSSSSLSFLTALTNCSFMRKLHLGSCLFAGSLPTSIGDLSKDLYYFSLLNNLITGDIPDSIGNLSSLVTLNLHGNFLEGNIPAGFAKLGQLQRLYLGRNKLQGEIPDEMGQMANLGLLELSNNLVSGSIPSSLGNLSQLRYLYLSENHLSGKFPLGVTGCSLLMLLDLSFNNLHGSLPVEIGLYPNLALSLNISNNNLEGEIPPSIGNLASALAIDLSMNKFSGVIPSLMGRCIALVYLNLSNNKFEGIIPESLKQIMHLEILDLACNQLSGNIPLWIANEQVIKAVNLSYNRLTGEVPNTGIFTKLNRSSFLGNSGLCGGPGLISLPPCRAEKRKQKKRKWVLYAFAIVGSCFLLLLVIITVYACCFFFRKKAQERVDPFSMTTQTFTQRELEVATSGFSEANLLGEGSFGRVYKAVINDGKTVVAVKVLHEECIQSCRSLKRECQILSTIKHRNLVKMVGSTWSAQFKALVLEFVGNGNLEQHLYPRGDEEVGCQLTLKERLGIAIDVALGLEYLHEGCIDQIVHCDIKPQNVLLDNDMVAHVADFGIGKIIAVDKPNGYVSTTGFPRGSVGYIPPEYGQGIKASTKGDVYSYGVMLLEMITRKKPTSEMFSDGLDLRRWVGVAFPNHVLDVVDISLKQEAYSGGGSDALHRLQQCCAQLLDAGLLCAEGDPQKRPPISLVTRQLQNAWKEMGFDKQYVQKL